MIHIVNKNGYVYECSSFREAMQIVLRLSFKNEKPKGIICDDMKNKRGLERYCDSLHDSINKEVNQ